LAYHFIETWDNIKWLHTEDTFVIYDAHNPRNKFRLITPQASLIHNLSARLAHLHRKGMLIQAPPQQPLSEIARIIVQTPAASIRLRSRSVQSGGAGSAVSGGSRDALGVPKLPAVAEEEKEKGSVRPSVIVDVETTAAILALASTEDESRGKEKGQDVSTDSGLWPGTSSQTGPAEQSVVSQHQSQQQQLPSAPTLLKTPSLLPPFIKTKSFGQASFTQSTSQTSQPAPNPGTFSLSTTTRENPIMDFLSQPAAPSTSKSAAIETTTTTAQQQPEPTSTNIPPSSSIIPPPPANIWESLDEAITQATKAATSNPTTETTMLTPTARKMITPLSSFVRKSSNISIGSGSGNDEKDATGTAKGRTRSLSNAIGPSLVYGKLSSIQSQSQSQSPQSPTRNRQRSQTAVTKTTKPIKQQQQQQQKQSSLGGNVITAVVDETTTMTNSTGALLESLQNELDGLSKMLLESGNQEQNQNQNGNVTGGDNSGGGVEATVT
ncbi:hypothetical protein HDU76_010425, partial [Blyttiomyces sp. JEL0837]